MRKRKTQLAVFLAALIILCSGCVGIRPTDTDEVSYSGACVIFTGDVHCGVDKGFGYAGLWNILESLSKQGYYSILVDCGDAIQGEAIGTLSRGEAIIDLMNAMEYDVAIPGNHEFDYGADRFMELTQKAEFPYISCNINRNGELVFSPYIIFDGVGLNIAFVGVTTPETLTSSSPSNFIDENGNRIYDFMQDDTGEKLYAAVQDAVDAARSEDVDLVYLVGHTGMDAKSQPWTYADIIEHTSGIDAYLDGHSHDTEHVTMKNKDGKPVTRIGAGTKLNVIGYSFINKDGTLGDTGTYSWTNDVDAAALFGLKNEISYKISQKEEELDAQLNESIGQSVVDLTINDPSETAADGTPLRMIRRAETNLGDFCADAFREQSGADICLLNSGSIRDNIKKGPVTYGDLLSVFPFGNSLCVVEATGQQILDALEWGAHALPEENGGFLQVSGLTYEVDTAVTSGCQKDAESMFTGIRGDKRRVQNVTVGGKPLDPGRTYTVAGQEFLLLEHGDGYTMFDGAKLLQDRVTPDIQLLADYIASAMEGSAGRKYADPYGQGRIVIKE